MKKVEAIVRKGRVEDITEALEKVGVLDFTMSKVLGCGQQKGHTKLVEGQEESINFVPKVKIEFVTLDNKVEQVVNILVQEARTGKIGDGKIMIYSI